MTNPVPVRLFWQGTVPLRLWSGETISAPMAAAGFGVKYDTFLDWMKKGKVKAYRTPGGSYFMTVDEARELAGDFDFNSAATPAGSES